MNDQAFLNLAHSLIAQVTGLRVTLAKSKEQPGEGRFRCESGVIDAATCGCPLGPFAPIFPAFEIHIQISDKPDRHQFRWMEYVVKWHYLSGVISSTDCTFYHYPASTGPLFYTDDERKGVTDANWKAEERRKIAALYDDSPVERVQIIDRVRITVPEETDA